MVKFARVGAYEKNQLKMNGEMVEQLNEFVYLGRMFEITRNLDAKILRRVNAGRKILWMAAKVAIYNSVLILKQTESWMCQKMHKSKEAEM